MKTLILADLHLKSNDLFGKVSEDEKGNKIEQRSLDKTKKVFDIVTTLSPERVIFAGDVFDSSTPAEWLRKQFFFIVSSLTKIKFYIISGNHDNKHSYPAGFSEANLLENCIVIPAGKNFVTEDKEFNLIGYTRDDELFQELAKDEAEFLVSHRDIPSFELNYEACFFGHVHKHYQERNCYSIGSMFKISWAEEKEDCYYLLVQDIKFQFVVNKDLNLKTFEIVDRNFPTKEEVGKFDAVRFEIKDTIDYINTVKEDEISKNYEIKVFFKYSPTEMEIDLSEIEDPKEAVKKLLETKNLTEEQLNFGMKFL